MTRATLLVWRAWTVVWRPNWPRRWRDRWRWLARRWTFALVGFAVGVFGVMGWQFNTLEDLWATESQVQDLQAQLLASQGQRSPPQGASGPPQAMAWWPDPGTQAAMWPQLQQTLSQHGMALLSLRPQASQVVTAWPSQAVALRMRGRFDDWVAAWAALNARGPVWDIDRLRITAQEGGVDIDVVLRLWLKPPSAASSMVSAAGVVDVPQEPSRVAAQWRTAAGAHVFVSKHALAHTTSTALAQAGVIKAASQVLPPHKAGEQSGPDGLQAGTSERLASPVSPDPVDWPLDQVRLAGVWQQSNDKQLILMAGPHWVRARVGQPIGPHGHVVHSIYAQEVHLRAAQGPVRVIALEKAKP